MNRDIRAIIGSVVTGFSLVFVCLFAGGVSATEVDEGVEESAAAPVVVEAADTDHSDEVTADEVTEALEAMPDLLEASEDVVTTADADSALIATTDEVTVDVPKDAADGITLETEDGESISIELPNAESATAAEAVADGVVAYASDDGSANAVQADAEGVRMLTVIDNAGAPTEYDYTVTVPGGGWVELTAEGGAVVLDADSQVVFAIDTPWAKDANDVSLNTWFTTDGQTLVQHIDHTAADVAYPVTADPYFVWGWNGVTVYFNKSDTRVIAMGVGFAATALTRSGLGAGGSSLGYELASWAMDKGYCLASYKSWFRSVPTFWLYRC